MRVFSPNPRSVFVYSGAWLGLADPHDEHHHEALVIQRNIATSRPRLIISNFVTDETYTLIRYRTSYEAAARFFAEVKASSLTVIRVTPQDEEQAEELLMRYSDKRYSYTDATSFVIIARLEIEAAFTFDGNFTQHGLRVLTP